MNLIFYESLLNFILNLFILLCEAPQSRSLVGVLYKCTIIINKLRFHFTKNI